MFCDVMLKIEVGDKQLLERGKFIFLFGQYDKCFYNLGEQTL